MWTKNGMHAHDNPQTQMNEGDWVPLAFAKDLDEANRYRRILDQMEIPSTLAGEYLSWSKGHSHSNGIELMVPAGLQTQAEEILAHYSIEDPNVEGWNDDGVGAGYDEEEEEEFDDDDDDEFDDDDDDEFDDEFDDDLDEEGEEDEDL